MKRLRSSDAVNLRNLGEVGLRRWTSFLGEAKNVGQNDGLGAGEFQILERDRQVTLPELGHLPEEETRNRLCVSAELKLEVTHSIVSILTVWLMSGRNATREHCTLVGSRYSRERPDRRR